MYINISIIQQLDLLTVGLTIAAIGILGWVVFLQDTKSSTGVAFLWFSILTILYGLINYLSYQVTSSGLALTLLRVTLFISTFHALSFFHLSHVFPKNKVNYSNFYKYIIIPTVSTVALLTLTPFVFTEISSQITKGEVVNPERGFGIIIFVFTTFSLIVGALYSLLKKMLSLQGILRKQVRTLFIGATLTFVLILVFSILLPVVFNILYFLPLASAFFFPMAVFAAYGILKYKLLNIKVIATEIFVFIILIVALLQILVADSQLEKLFTFGIFVALFVFSILLIKSIDREVKQREQIELLAKNLKKANERLQELDRLKSEFVSIASHQLRSPLTAIKGYASLILEGTFGDTNKAVTEAIEKIFESSKLMTVSVQDFLDVSRIEQGTMKYNFEKFELDTLVSTVAEELTPVANEGGLKLGLHITPNENYTVQADMGKMKQILYNLIDNSIKYTPKGSVDIVMCRVGEKINIEIRDTGVGVEKETIPKLFAKFVRSRNAHHVNVSGTGLGLFVVKQMVEAHNGRVWVTSEGKGKGSIFHVELNALPG